MASYDYDRGGTAVKTRKKGKDLLLGVILGILLIAVAAVILSLVRTSRVAEVPAEDTDPEEFESVTATEEPLLPEAMEHPSEDTSVELAERAVNKRDGFPMLSWDKSLFADDGNGYLYYKGAAKTLTGIDVSEHQYDIDWARVAATGDIDFAMIRMGYRGSTAGGLYTDEYFKRNIEDALAAGIPVGVYFYSQAVSVQEAEEEAEYLLNAIAPYKVTYPVVFDWEIVGGDEARTYTVPRRTICDATRTFCDKVEAAGYKPMIYFTQYLAYRKLILRNLTDYAFWYAEYEAEPNILFDFDMWQYSATGHVDGIEGEVDLNILFVK